MGYFGSAEASDVDSIDDLQGFVQKTGLVLEGDEASKDALKELTIRLIRFLLPDSDLDHDSWGIDNVEVTDRLIKLIGVKFLDAGKSFGDHETTEMLDVLTQYYRISSSVSGDGEFADFKIPKFLYKSYLDRV